MYFIYFIKISDTVKIGICEATLKHLKQRLSEAQRWCPSATINGFIFSYEKEIEKQIHLYFDELRIKNEVFEYDKKIIRFVKKYCDWAIGKKYLYLPFSSCPSFHEFKRYIRYINVFDSYDVNDLKTDIVSFLNYIDKIKNYSGKYLNIEVKEKGKEYVINFQLEKIKKWQKQIKETKRRKRQCLEFLRKNLISVSVSWQDVAIYHEMDSEIENRISLDLVGDEYGGKTWNYHIDYDKLWLQLYDKYLSEYSKKKLDVYSKLYGLMSMTSSIPDDLLPNLQLTKKEKEEREKFYEYDLDDWTSDDFTGIGDDGFYYVDGEFCINDPLGIESY